MKIALTDITNLQNETSVTANINGNNTTVENAIENTLSRDGTSPNSMGATLDMDSNPIINLPGALLSHEPIRKAEFDSATIHSLGIAGTGFISTNAGINNAYALTGTANEITVTNGTGGAIPVFSLPNALTFSGKTVTGGTFSSGVFSGTYNGNTFTTGTGTLTIAAGKVFTSSNTLTFTGTDGSSVAFGSGGTILYSGAAAGGDLTGTYPNPTIGTNKVTNAKLAQMAAISIKGNTSGSIANAADLTGTQALAILALSSNALTASNDTNVTLTLGGTPTTALITSASLTLGWTGTLAASRGGFGSDVSASSGVPLFATGTPTFTSTSGTGNFVRVTSPTLVTPILGAATATSLNGNTYTTGTGTLTLGTKTLTVSNTVTFTGTDGSTIAFGTGGTILYSGASAGGDLTGTYPNPTLAGIISAGGPTGSATAAPVITYDAKGRLTAVSSATVTPAIASVTGWGANVLTAVGTSLNTASGLVGFSGALGTPTSGVATNLTGTASGLTSGNVTTNANLTGDVTSVGNATTLTNAPVIAKVLTGYASGAGTVSASDSILTAIQKLNGNDATNANLTGDVTSVGNATTLASVITAGGPTGSATVAPIVTYDAKGRLTTVSSATITPAIASVTGWGTGVLTAVGTAVGSAGAPVLFNGAGGTPSSLALTNATLSGVAIAAGQFPGETTTGSATAGNIGEYVSSTVVSGSAVSITSGAAKTVTSISLTAGDWDVTGVTSFLPANTTSATILLGSLSLTNNTLDLTPGRVVDLFAGAVIYDGSTASHLVMPTARFSLASTTTVYLIAYSVFTISTNSAYGIIRARRAR